ncbi:hypothetical protein [Kutzneria albida]|uniref:Uncharacterized protein n=1 Tax=Kutzneria albida DSM 43870 TaxID=1449976 RepID=W5WKA2_9PSEU|nr:hypothetical protein [Kutzneria albida]AHH98609.1 hypothetical protein KALB_5247 [Kutzneria albida DSM 43870]
MLVELIPAPQLETTPTDSVAQVVFDTLPALGLDRMTEGRVEFVLCASALTAQV